jgi:ATP-dependent DNA ligase
MRRLAAVCRSSCQQIAAFQRLFRSVRDLGLEGIVAKKLSQRY